MDIQTIKRRARSQYLIGLGICLVAAMMATMEAMNGNWILWGITIACFLVSGACVLMNIRIATRGDI